jgi:hypothetical protein
MSITGGLSPAHWRLSLWAKNAIMAVQPLFTKRTKAFLAVVVAGFPLLVSPLQFDRLVLDHDGQQN